MEYTSDVIQKVVARGHKPGLVSGKKIVRLYLCHKCRQRSMVKAYGPVVRYNVCKCGYIKEF